MTVLKSILAGVACVALCGPAIAENRPLPPVKVSIESQPLEDALNEFAKQTGFQVLFQSDAVLRQTAPRVDGELTPESALKALLANSGLRYKFVNPRTVSISTADETASAAGGGQWKMARVDAAMTGNSNASLGQAAGQEQSNSTNGDTSGASLEEIIVTAQKRAERLQDVPVAVTAISAQSLIDSNQLRLQDYYTRIPGLTVVPMDLGGHATVTIRGITTGGYTNPTAGIVIDDVPYGSSTYKGLGEGLPDIDPSDLARLEVLRGPQGTLYGASSIGGLLKFVTIDPSTDGFSGRVQAGTSSVRNGSELGYNLRGSLNAPLGETFAVRASGFTRQEPGYIDNPITGADGVNEVTVSGGRLAALWRPSDTLSLKLGALYQDTKGDGPFDIQPSVGEFQQAYLRGTGDYRNRTYHYSATLAASLGAVDLTSISGYSINRYFHNFDFTASRGAFAQARFGVPGASSVQNYKTEKFTQEARLSAPVGQRFEWLLGGFYNRETSPQTADIYAIDPATGGRAGTILNYIDDFTFQEYAAFASLTYHLTEKLDLQVGGRQSYNRQTSETTQSGPLAGGVTLTIPKTHSKDDAFTYLGSLRYKVSPDLMIYTRLASGYRPGGPNTNPALINAPRSYSSDTTSSYEVGIKGAALNRALSFDVSLYYIDWNNMQIALISGGQYIDNAGKAKSQGAEFTVTATPLSGMTLETSLSWSEAKLTQAFPANSPVVAPVDERLPNSPRFSGNLSIDQEFPLSASMAGFVGGSVSYMGERIGVFRSVAQRQELAAYASTDLRAGVRFDSWQVNVYANNIADKRGVIQGGLGTFIPSAFQYIQPRTIGLNVLKTF